MKTKNILLTAGIIGLAATTLTGVVAQAATTTSKGNGKASVTLKSKSGSVVDPTEPGVTDPITPPVDPTEPEVVNPPIGNLDDGAQIAYYPNFNFGVHTYATGQATTYDAIALESDGQTRPHFFQVLNTPDAQNWTVSVSAGQFESLNNKKLAGLEMKLKNVEVVTQAGNAATTSNTTYTLKPGTGSVTLANYTKPTNDPTEGVSINSIVFGKTTDLKATPSIPENLDQGGAVTETYPDGSPRDVIKAYNQAVQLDVPSTLTIDATETYNSTLEWTLESTI